LDVIEEVSFTVLERHVRKLMKYSHESFLTNCHQGLRLELQFTMIPDCCHENIMISCFLENTPIHSTFWKLKMILHVSILHIGSWL